MIKADFDKFFDVGFSPNGLGKAPNMLCMEIRISALVQLLTSCEVIFLSSTKNSQCCS